MTPAPSLSAPTSAASFSDRFWGLAPGPETLDVPEPLRTVVIVRHFLAVLDALARGPRKTVPAIGALLRASELDGCSSYASPEQLRGEPLDTRSVVFSLGVVLFEKLAGRHPFGAENNRPRQITRIQRGEMGSGVNSFPTIAASVRSVLVRAMNPFSEERWPDLRPMRDLLEQFLATDAPHPRLPGTASSDDLPAEPTRVVRRATDFGRELMDVVARHERPESPSPKALRPASWPAIAAESPAPAAPPHAAPPHAAPPHARTNRPTPPPTPRLGVTVLRPPAPRRLVPAVSEDSVITRIDPARIDPLGATLRVTMERAIAEAANDDSQASITAPLPSPASVVPGAVESRSAAATAGSLPRAPADAPSHLTELSSLAPPPRPRRTFTVPPTARPHSDPIPDLRVASRSKTLLVALASAAIGAGAATIAVIALRPDAPPTSSTIAPPSPPAAEPVENPPAPPAPAPASASASAPASAAAPASASAAAPASASAAAPAPADDPAARLHAAIAPCVATDSHRVFGISVVARGAGAKAYFGPADGLTPAERSCISNAVKPLGGMPTEAGYKIRVDATGLAVSLR